MGHDENACTVVRLRPTTAALVSSSQRIASTSLRIAREPLDRREDLRRAGGEKERRQAREPLLMLMASSSERSYRRTGAPSPSGDGRTEPRPLPRTAT